MAEYDEYFAELNNQQFNKKSPNKLSKIKLNNELNELTEKIMEEEGPETDEIHQFIKQVKYALNREENQPAVTSWKLILGFICIFSFIFVVTNFTLMVTAITKINYNLEFFEFSFKTQRNFVIANYLIREMTLVNLPNYTNYYGLQFKEEYSKNLTRDLLALYNNTTEMDKKIQSYNGELGNENKKALYDTVKPLFLLQQGVIKQINATISTSLSEMSSTIFKIGYLNKTQITDENNFVFLYLYNSMNDFFTNLWKLSEVYHDELKTQINQSLVLNIIVLSFSLVIFVAGYTLSIVTFRKVIEKKESYLAVFFEINNNVIKESLKKCENFIKYINSEKQGAEEESSIGDQELYEDEKQNLLKKTSGFSVDKSVLTKSSGELSSQNLTSTEFFYYKITSFFSNFCILILLATIFYFYQNDLSNVSNYSEVFIKTSKFQIKSLNEFNVVRETMRNPKAKIFNLSAIAYAKNTSAEVYNLEEQLFNTTFINQESIPQKYFDFFQQMYYNDICYLAKDEFVKYKINCQALFSNSSSYGLNMMLGIYYENIKQVLNEMDVILGDSIQSYSTYSQTLKDEISINAKTFPLMNSDRVRDLNMIWRYLLKPAFEMTLQNMCDSMLSDINYQRTVYIIVFSVFLALIMLMYFFFIIPHQVSTHQSIYNAKNMLSIIPIEVVAGLNNIKRLLNIKHEVE